MKSALTLDRPARFWKRAVIASVIGASCVAPWINETPMLFGVPVLLGSFFVVWGELSGGVTQKAKKGKKTPVEGYASMGA
jgi:hypothetical protein